MSRLTASRVAFDLIASFEGYRARAARTPDGQWTLGFGHSATAREGLTVTRAEAEDLLRWDLLPIEDTLRQVALMPLTQNQFDALVSFVFNIGLENFKTSDVLKSLNQGQPVAAALAMHAWRRARVNGQVLTIDALVRRRAAESALFLETTGARPAAPTSVIRPQIDYSAALLSHGVESSIVTTPLEGEIVPTAASTSIPQVAIGPAPNLDTDFDAVPQTSLVSPISTAIQAQIADTDILVGGVQQSQPTEGLVDSGRSDTSAQGSLAQDTASPQVPTSTQQPMLPHGLSPFPGSQMYVPANGTGGQLNLPANDGAQSNRLHAVPELVSAGGGNLDVQAAQTEESDARPETEKTAAPSLLLYSLLALGALLLAGGLYYAWQSGILTVQSPSAEPTNAQLAALLAAASGLIILVTSAVGALTGGAEADTKPAP